MYDLHVRARRNRRLIWLIAAVAVAVLLVAAVLVGVLIGRTADPVSTPSNPPSSPGADARSPHADTGDDEVNDGASPPADGENPLATVSWDLWQGVALPVSPTLGPKTTDGDVARGFDRSPGGAALAAIHILVRSGSPSGPAVFEPTINDQVVGDDADAFLAATTSNYESKRLDVGAEYGDPLPQDPLDFRGYRVESPSEDAVPVHLLVASVDDSGEERCLNIRAGMVWQDGDWRLTAPPGGDGSAINQLVPCQMDTYTPIPRQG